MNNSIYDALEYEEDADIFFDIIFDYGESHEDMHSCFERAVNFVKSLGYDNVPCNEKDIKQMVFDALQDIITEGVEEDIRHRWEFKDFSTHEFVCFLTCRLSALSCTYQRYIEPDQPEGLFDDASGGSVH